MPLWNSSETTPPPFSPAHGIPPDTFPAREFSGCYSVESPSSPTDTGTLPGYRIQLFFSFGHIPRFFENPLLVMSLIQLIVLQHPILKNRLRVPNIPNVHQIFVGIQAAPLCQHGVLFMQLHKILIKGRQVQTAALQYYRRQIPPKTGSERNRCLLPAQQRYFA